MTLGDRSLDAFLAALGAKQPAPGGGAVAAVTAALSAATGLMVVRYSAGRRKLAAHAELHAEAERALLEAQTRAVELADADAEAYGRMSALWKLDPDDETRRRELPAAVRAAIDVPERVGATCIEMLELYGRLCGRTNAALNSDLVIAALLAEAGAGAAACNVRVNLPALADDDDARRLEQETADRLDTARRLRERVEEACR